MEVFSVTLTNRSHLTPSTDLITLSFMKGVVFSFTPGQYVMLSVPFENNTVTRLYSIASSSQNKNSIELLIKYVKGGASSSYLSSLPLGSPLTIKGPAGLFSIKETEKDKIFFVTGSGFAPVRSYLLSSPPEKRSTYLFWGNATYEETCLVDEVVGLSLKNSLLHPIFCLSKTPSLDHLAPEKRPYFSYGRINDVWEKTPLFTLRSNFEYYLCGRREVVESMRNYLYNQNIDKSVVFFERY